jgi:hypothetical protein
LASYSSDHKSTVYNLCLRNQKSMMFLNKICSNVQQNLQQPISVLKTLPGLLGLNTQRKTSAFLIIAFEIMIKN